MHDTTSSCWTTSIRSTSSTQRSQSNGLSTRPAAHPPSSDHNGRAGTRIHQSFDFDAIGIVKNEQGLLILRVCERHLGGCRRIRRQPAHVRNPAGKAIDGIGRAPQRKRCLPDARRSGNEDAHTFRECHPDLLELSLAPYKRLRRSGP